MILLTSTYISTTSGFIHSPAPTMNSSHNLLAIIMQSLCTHPTPHFACCLSKSRTNISLVLESAILKPFSSTNLTRNFRLNLYIMLNMRSTHISHRIPSRVQTRETSCFQLYFGWALSGSDLSNVGT